MLARIDHAVAAATVGGRLPNGDQVAVHKDQVVHQPHPQGGQGGGNEPPPPPPPSGGGDGLGGLAGLGSLLGQIDPKWINRLLPLVGELTGGGSDERMQLLYALRPFLKPERQDKVERAAKTARLIHVGKKLLQSMGESDV